MTKYIPVGDYTEDMSDFLYKEIPGGVIIEKIEVLMDEDGHDYLYVRYCIDGGVNQVLERLIDESFIKTLKHIAKRINKYHEAYINAKNTVRF